MHKVSFALLVGVTSCGSHDPELTVDISDLSGVLTDVTDVALDRDTVCALAANRAVCGTVSEGVTPVYADLGLLVDIAVSPTRTCVDSNGDIVCWGADRVSARPAFATGTYVVVGDQHTCVMTNDAGHTICEGGIAQDLGPSYMLYGAPRRACVVTPARRLVCAEAGALPQLLDQPRDVGAVALSDTHACASDRTTWQVRCWGDNAYGQLARDPTRTPFVVTPQDVALRATVLAAGEAFTCALTAVRGEVWCWGQGFGFVPVRVALPALPMDVVARHHQACAVLENNTLACWTATTAPTLIRYAK